MDVRSVISAIFFPAGMSVTSDFAVTYTAAQLSTPRYTSVADLRLDEHGIKYVRVQYVDYSNMVRFRVLPVSYFKRVCKLARPSLNFLRFALAFVGSQVADGFSSMDECVQSIDLNSFRVCTYAPGHAVVMAWFQEKIPSPTGDLAMPLCPRTMLQNVVDEAKQKADLTFLVGFESEFILLKATSPPELVNDAGWGCSAGYRTDSVESRVLDEIVDCVEEAGIEVHFIHGETAPAQYELVTGPMSPLEAADALVFTREAIYNIAHKHGLRATFAPRLLSDSLGSGAHMHLSLHSSVPSALSSRLLWSTSLPSARSPYPPTPPTSVFKMAFSPAGRTRAGGGITRIRLSGFAEKTELTNSR